MLYHWYSYLYILILVWEAVFSHIAQQIEHCTISRCYGNDGVLEWPSIFWRIQLCLCEKERDTVCTILDSLLYKFYYIHWFYNFKHNLQNVGKSNQIGSFIIINLVMKMLQMFLNKIHFKILLWIPSSEHWLFAFRLHYLMLLILPFLYNLFVFVFRVKLGGKLTSLLNCRFL